MPWQSWWAGLRWYGGWSSTNFLWNDDLCGDLGRCPPCGVCKQYRPTLHNTLHKVRWGYQLTWWVSTEQVLRGTFTWLKISFMECSFWEEPVLRCSKGPQPFNISNGVLCSSSRQRGWILSCGTLVQCSTFISVKSKVNIYFWEYSNTETKIDFYFLSLL